MVHINTKCIDRSPKLILDFIMECLKNRKQLRLIFIKNIQVPQIIINKTNKVAEYHGRIDLTKTPNI